MRLDHFRQIVRQYHTGWLTNLLRGWLSGQNKPSAECAKYLFGGRLIPIEKPDGGIRPVVVTEAIVRVFERILVQYYTGAVKTKLSPIQ